MGYHIQGALIIVLNGQPKVLCACFVEDNDQYWHSSRGERAERQTVVYITVCSQVPYHTRQLWTPGAGGSRRAEIGGVRTSRSQPSQALHGAVSNAQ